MTESYMNLSNSPAMWLACLPGILIVVFQAYKFFARTRKDAERMGLTKKQVNSAVRSAAITSIGPCFVMLTTMLTLMLYIGAPAAWLRVDFIGSVIYELQTAEMASNALGIELGSSSMDASFLATAILVTSVGCVPWVLFAALFSDKMEAVNGFMSGGNAKALPIIGVGGLIGLFCSLTVDKIYPVKTQVVAVVVAAAVMYAIQSYNQKANKQWLKEWNLTICMLAGMISATAAQSMGFLV